MRFIMPNFIALSQTIMTKVLQNFFFHPSVFWMVTYSKASSIKLPNSHSENPSMRYVLPKFVNSVDGLTNRHPQKMVNDMYLHTMRRHKNG